MEDKTAEYPMSKEECLKMSEITIEEIESAFKKATDPNHSILVRMHSPMTQAWEGRVAWLIARVKESEESAALWEKHKAAAIGECTLLWDLSKGAARDQARVKELEAEVDRLRAERGKIAVLVAALTSWFKDEEPNK